MLCPYVIKRTTEITNIYRDNDGNEMGSVIIYENDLMECSKECMAYRNGKCKYRGGGVN